MTECIGDDLRGRAKWQGCAIGLDGFIYSIPSSSRHILKVNPSKLKENSNSSSSSPSSSSSCTSLVGPDLSSYSPYRSGGMDKWSGCIANNGGKNDPNVYGIPYNANHILKYNTKTGKVLMAGENLAGDNRGGGMGYAVVGPGGAKIYFFPFYETTKILEYNPKDESTTLVGDHDLQASGWKGAVLSPIDKCIYCVPCDANKVLRFNPQDGTIRLIGNDLGSSGDKWSGAVIGEDGNCVFGIPCNHNYMLKIDVATQTTSFVGPNLGGGTYKYDGGVLGYDHCIFMIPSFADFVLKFNPLTNVAVKVGKDRLVDRGLKYSGGVLADDGYIYSTPFNAKRVLRVKAWDDFLYLKRRVLVERGRAVRKDIDNDDELKIVQHFITDMNDDIFRYILEMI